MGLIRRFHTQREPGEGGTGSYAAPCSAFRSPSRRDREGWKQSAAKDELRRQSPSRPCPRRGRRGHAARRAGRSGELRRDRQVADEGGGVFTEGLGAAVAAAVDELPGQVLGPASCFQNLSYDKINLEIQVHQ